MTKFCTVPDEPKELKVVMLNETAVSLSWAPPDSPNGVIVEYEVIYYGYMPVESNKVLQLCYCSWLMAIEYYIVLKTLFYRR